MEKLGAYQSPPVRGTRLPELKTWLLLKAAHTPFLWDTELTRTAPPTISVPVAIWEQSELAQSSSGTWCHYDHYSHVKNIRTSYNQTC